MINVRQGIVTLLQGSNAITPPVYSTRLDRLKSEDCPAISVINVNTTLNQLGHHLQFQASTSVGIVILVAKTDDYDVALDTLVDAVMGAIFLDEMWQQQFEAVPQFQINYDYDIAGETNTAQAKIIISTQYTDEYPVDIQDAFNKIHFDIDMAESDGIIDAEFDVDLSVL